MIHVAEMLWWLAVGHAVADFALQTDTMAKGKNWNSRPGNLPPGQVFDPRVWLYWMWAHSMIHGGAVALATGVWWIGAIEVALHFAIDSLKCANLTTIHYDQLSHAICKLAYIIIIFG